jgi:hypothetical protein
VMFDDLQGDRRHRRAGSAAVSPVYPWSTEAASTVAPVTG